MYVSLWALALLSLLRSPFAFGASNFHLRNHTGLLFLYDFTEGQKSEAVPTEARDITGRYLMGNLTTSPTTVSWSASRQGMSIPSVSGGVRAESQVSSAALLSHLSSEFSLEFFFSSPNNQLPQNVLLTGFGSWAAGAPFSQCDAANVVSEGGWRLSSTLGANLVFDGVFLVSGNPTCLSLSVSITTNTLRHFVVRGRDGLLSVVAHGSTATISDSNVVFSPSLWARHPAPLTIANPHPTSGWTGTMYMAAMYDRYFENAEITSNRDFGPPNSLPVTTPSLSIPEDETVTLFP